MSVALCTSSYGGTREEAARRSSMCQAARSCVFAASQRHTFVENATPSTLTVVAVGGGIFQPTFRRPLPGQRGRRPRPSSTRTPMDGRSVRPFRRPPLMRPSSSEFPAAATPASSFPVYHVAVKPPRCLLPVRRRVGRTPFPSGRSVIGASSFAGDAIVVGDRASSGPTDADSGSSRGGVAATTSASGPLLG